MKIRDARSARKSNRRSSGNVETPEEPEMPDDTPPSKVETSEGTVDKTPPAEQKPDEAPAAKQADTTDKTKTPQRSSKARRAKPAERARDTASGPARKTAPTNRAERSDDRAAPPEPPRERVGAARPSVERPPQAFDGDGPLLADADGYKDRWDRIQIGFVDEPLYAVESAGRLVAEVLGELASTFAARRKELEGQWRHDQEISTEELRLVFRGYRAFFNRIIR